MSSLLKTTAITKHYGALLVTDQVSLDIQQGAQWWLTNDEEKLLEHHNSQHRSISLVRERLMEILDLKRVGEPGLAAMGTVETFAKMGVLYPSNGDTKELTAILRELLGPSKKHNGTLKWRIPLRENIDVVKVEVPKPRFEPAH